jgi:hypothetical protein
VFPLRPRRRTSRVFGQGEVNDPEKEPMGGSVVVEDSFSAHVRLGRRGGKRVVECILTAKIISFTNSVWFYGDNTYRDSPWLVTATVVEIGELDKVLSPARLHLSNLFRVRTVRPFMRR